MKNAPFYLLIGIVAVILGLIALGVFLSVTQGGLPSNALSGFCAIVFLVSATILYELMTKRHLYRSRNSEEEPKSP